jgi:hypothetical protein
MMPDHRGQSRFRVFTYVEPNLHQLEIFQPEVRGMVISPVKKLIEKWKTVRAG